MKEGEGLEDSKSVENQMAGKSLESVTTVEVVGLDLSKPEDINLYAELMYESDLEFDSEAMKEKNKMVARDFYLKVWVEIIQSNYF